MICPGIETAPCGREISLSRRRPDGVYRAQGGRCTRCYARLRTGHDGSRAKRRWEDMVEDYELLRSDGLDLQQIADRMGIQKDSLAATLKRHADDPRAALPASYALTGPRGPVRRWQDYQTRYETLRRAGATLEEIAADVGVSYDALRSAVARHRAPKPRRAPRRASAQARQRFMGRAA